MLTLPQLRARAVTHTLFEARSLRDAVARIGFVQADPIRAPARAQDLILRQRVDGYGEGDLERYYAALQLEEDYLYAYGFLPRETARLLHPRENRTKLTAFDQSVLAAMRTMDVVHPRDLDALFQQRRVVNAWGGYSRETKRALERLHHHGLAHVAGRRSGVRLYRATAQDKEREDPHVRLRALITGIAHVLAPVSARTLHSLAARLQRWIPVRGGHRALIAALLREGVLEADACDGVMYLWPAASPSEPTNEAASPRVRLLAPFDPLVWDRARFEQLWGWPYRFEAYTPAAKRVRGYYALPLAWGDQVIGWANVLRDGDSLEVDLGFAGRRPRDRSFARELDAEIERMRSFAGARDGSVR